MLLSMTGIGEARVENERLLISVELRSVNNRHLKVSMRGPDGYLSLEHDIEKLIRARILRGTVSVQMRVERLDGAAGHAIDDRALRAYATRLAEVASELRLPPPTDIAALLALPGVLVESDRTPLTEEDWPLVEQAMLAAIERLNAFRAREGLSMAGELLQLTDAIDRSLAAVAERAPQVVAEYRQRLRDRIVELLRESGVTAGEPDLVREVGLFADRSDINEELTRLRCHVDQFRSLVAADEAAGRTMEFLCQEMNREINTIGSKANDVEIARRVVDAKGSIERIREIVQNVE